MIKNTFTAIYNFIKSHYIISIILLLIVAGVGWKIFASSQKKVESYTVVRGDVMQKVIVTGSTKPVHSVDLGFDTSGRVASVNVSVGSRVVAGQQLAALDTSDAYADYLKSQADLDSAKAKLKEMQAGTRPEEVSVSQTQLVNAQSEYDLAQKNLNDKVLDIVSNNIDSLFSNPHTSNPQINFVYLDGQLRNTVNTERFEAEGVITNWSNDKISTNLPKIKRLITDVATAVNSQTPNSTLTQTTIDTYKASLSSARAAIITAEDRLNTAKSNLDLSQKQLDLKKAGYTQESIDSQAAAVSRAEADLASKQAVLSKRVIRSPQNGVVTKKDVEVGEIVTAGKNVISVISDSDLEIEANVSEINIGKVAVGNPVVITMDAFPGEKFSGTVSYIDPGETLLDGVVNYKVTIAINKSDKTSLIKSGLTTNLEIITNTKSGVLRVPVYSVKDGKVLKQVAPTSKEFVESPVTLGVVGGDGYAEAVSGVNEGDVIRVDNTTTQ